MATIEPISANFCKVKFATQHFINGDLQNAFATLKDKLVRGDIITVKDDGTFRAHNYIYDGASDKMMTMDHDCHWSPYGNIPKQFKVLDAKHALPFNYWSKIRAYEFNNVVWFDHKPYSDELKRNISYDLKLTDDQTFNLYTWFMFNNKKHYIMYNYFDRLLTERYKRYTMELTGAVLEKLHRNFSHDLSQSDIVFFPKYNSTRDDILCLDASTFEQCPTCNRDCIGTCADVPEGQYAFCAKYHKWVVSGNDGNKSDIITSNGPRCEMMRKFFCDELLLI